MKKIKCLICESAATVRKEVLIALSCLHGVFKSTNKKINFCESCYKQATPVFIVDEE